MQTKVRSQVTTNNIDELLSELKEREELNHDFLVPANLIKMDGDTMKVYRRSGEVREYTPNKLFHDQMASYLSIPRPYYQRLLESRATLTHTAPDDDMRMVETPLFNTTVNVHLADKGEDVRLLRVQDGTARAFLSDKFSTDLDNYEVATYAVRAMQAMGIPNECVARAGVTHERLFLQVLAPGLKAFIHPINDEPGRPKDVIEGGFQLTNSEVGLGSLELSLYTRRLVCMNGATHTKVVKRRHVGRVLTGDDDGIYSNETRQSEAVTRLLALRDHIKELLTGDLFRNFITLMQDAAYMELPVHKKPLGDVVEVTKKKLNLADCEAESVLLNLQSAKDNTLYGLGNAVTATARETNNADRRLELERMGGEVFGWRGYELTGITR